jgi:hypothetical protein
MASSDSIMTQEAFARSNCLEIPDKYYWLRAFLVSKKITDDKKIRFFVWHIAC